MGSNEMLGEKGIAVQTDKVFMQPGVYGGKVGGIH
ncbi:MAG: hypothetical protein UX68_C0046G0007 [Parcubacteria group bacterium GW2011_GWA2_46_9]|nr:MAG: hypothetical protein UX68_C0046G0007 [Parcubacteria group bacterium GW2011_GWA2_46_9]